MSNRTEVPVVFIGGPMDGRTGIVARLHHVVIVPTLLPPPPESTDVVVPLIHHRYKPRLDAQGRMLGPSGRTALDYLGAVRL